jgi:hypothetical protein
VNKRLLSIIFLQLLSIRTPCRQFILVFRSTLYTVASIVTNMNELIWIVSIFVAATFLIVNTTPQGAKAQVVSCSSASVGRNPPPPISAHCGPTFCSVQSSTNQLGALGQSSSSGKGSCSVSASAQGNFGVGVVSGATPRGSTCSASAISNSGIGFDFNFGSGTSGGCSASTHSP